ncbi:ribosomal l1 domain-containing protein 1-like [Stylonychia lemnae]|uniref:Ribosomal l1 domain-containing protein 1-like n=1 Tax=Stylonychia lemnae TaxID=5949 RepID=A0A078ACM5_STYLE|nr:ribosomal l1 domain-containing protein 1-like [Stylonychia lemnae]|eukprot:CDW78588.1 ribosomal l1 domain-containing protein 1-like [Stylonychia lemnae]
MARQMLTQKYQEEIKERKQIRQKQEEGLGKVKYLTNSHFQNIIAESNKYLKIEKQTKLKLKLDKLTVLKVVNSLIDFNRKLLKSQGIEENVDDYIFLNIKMNISSDYDQETPIQLKVPFPLFELEDNKTEVLLIVKEKPEIYIQMCEELNFLAIKEIKTVIQVKKDCQNGKGNVVKKYLNQFDMILIDDRLSSASVEKDLGGQGNLIKKRNFPIPVKINGLNTLEFKKVIQEASETVGLLLTGGNDFIVKCAKSESMTKKEIVKNVMQAALRAICLIIYSQKKIKNNGIKQIQLQTTKSMPLPIQDNDDLKQQTDE